MLEMDWAATLSAWKVDWEFHPGTLALSNGEYWEPDFLLRNAAPWGVDILFEVKGPHNDRLHKAVVAQEDHPDLLVLIGRESWLNAEYLNSYAGAVWHKPDGSRYDWDINGKGFEYVSAEKATTEKPGLKFFRAIENSRKLV